MSARVTVCFSSPFLCPGILILSVSRTRYLNLIQVRMSETDSPKLF